MADVLTLRKVIDGRTVQGFPALADYPERRAGVVGMPGNGRDIQAVGGYHRRYARCAIVGFTFGAVTCLPMAGGNIFGLASEGERRAGASFPIR